MSTRYFTKSLFKLALVCPTKLYYFGKLQYKNDQEEDSFLEALKDGGYQVGALAKAYVDGGKDLEDCDNEQAYNKTQELLKQENVIIYEALFRHENMQIRADILIKNGSKIEIIEVKSKSYCEEDCSKFRDKDGKIISEFRNRNGSLISEWKEYLLDVAFQAYVVDSVIPQNLQTSYYLMLIDKDQTSPVDGLNQKFLIKKPSGTMKATIITKQLTSEDKSRWLLKKINVDNQIRELKQEQYKIDQFEMSFDLYIKTLADNYTSDSKISTSLGGKCKNCEFNSSFAEEMKGLKSGFRECWKQTLHWQDIDFEDKTVLELWRCLTKDRLLKEGKVKLNELSQEDLNLKDETDALSQSARQWLQIEKNQKGDNEVYIHPKLVDVMSQWKFPLHFIDFETCTVPIPFHRGQHPYEPLAFQYSHHTLYDDGKIEHKGQYMESGQGVFPNYDFVRSLKKELEQDQGTIFRFHNHENNILNAIYEQLSTDQNENKDKDDLMEFIASITIKNDKNKSRRGLRYMVDLEEILRRYTYLPSTDGRTSMKVTFPAILKSSSILQQKYSQPIYGAKNGIKSLNFTNWRVIEKDSGGEIMDPYSRLPDVFDNVPSEDIELFKKAEKLREIKDVREGGMASTAYALMQFTEMLDVERSAIKASLLKYCEIDTLAMAILYEFLQEASINGVS